MDRHAHLHEMTNSHLLVQEFDYYEPESLAEAIGLLVEHGDCARVLAGGTDLVVMMKMERENPEAVINIRKIPDLYGVQANPRDGTLSIGALTSIYTLHKHPLVQALYPALAEACASFGSTQVEVMGTIGGNLCNGSPAADTAPVLLVLDAQLVLTGPQGERRLPVEAFFLGPGKTALQAGELLARVILPAPRVCSASLFLKVSRVTADLAKASLAIQLVRKDGKIASARVAMGSVAPTPLRLPRVESILTGQALTEEVAAQAGQTAAEEISPIDDVRSSAWYRRQVANAMTQDALRMAWERTYESPDVPMTGYREGGTLPSAEAGTVRRGEVKEIKLRVNGRMVKARAASHDLLLNLLREQMELTGAKYACGIGECGACTVLVDGKPALACLILAVSAAGEEITTIEGLQDPHTGALDPLQESFIENTGFQCGYCTPGMILTAKALLNETSQPDEDHIRSYLRGNLCRCTGYASIVRSVLNSVERPGK